MIKIFGATDEEFSTNGDKILNVGKAKVHKADNGDYYLDLECDLSYLDYIVQGNIVVADTPNGDQAFRISDVEKTKFKIKVKAWHVFYDSKNYLIADSYVVNKTCNDALDHLNSATDNPSPFTTISDITTVDSYRCVRESLYNAVFTVLERWGGHLDRDNFEIGVRAEIGQDNGVTVRYKKNLQDITCSENWDDVVTKLLPVGKDGLLLDELYVYSEKQYDIPYTKTVSFDQSDVNEDDYKDEDGNLNEQAYQQALIEDLRSQAVDYVAENQNPKVNYTLKANLEKITDVGDTVEVIDERLGINILTHVISYDYDCILKKYTQIEFGNFEKQLSGLVDSITSETNKNINEKGDALRVTLENELQEATGQIWGALGSSYVIYEGDKILVVDKLPKEEATNVLMINNGGIGFSNTGINGTFTSCWTLDGTLNMQAVNVINLTADLIKGGTLKLGSNLNQSGILEVYDVSNTLIARMDKDGLKVYGTDGSYVLMNAEVGFAGYDINDNKIFWAASDEFHMKKSVVEEEITLCNKVRFIPITIYDEDNNIVNDGIGLVSTVN